MVKRQLLMAASMAFSTLPDHRPMTSERAGTKGRFVVSCCMPMRFSPRRRSSPFTERRSSTALAAALTAGPSKDRSGHTSAHRVSRTWRPIWWRWPNAEIVHSAMLT